MDEIAHVHAFRRAFQADWPGTLRRTASGRECFASSAGFGMTSKQVAASAMANRQATPYNLFDGLRCLRGVRMDELGRDFDDFVTASSPSLLRTAYLLTGDHGHAEDALQHALMATARHWRTIHTDPVAYTRRTVVNLAKNRWRARSRRVVEVSNSTEPTYGPPDQAVALSQALVGALRQVPYQQRTVLVLRYFEDLSIEQTAEVLGCSAGTVKSQSHHGLAKLRELIGDPADFEEITDAH